jgi:lipopolysaccharide/colanic/teichoic acid biosynthesis glycosyltransferase
MFYCRYGKRLCDLALTVPALIVLAPLLALVALAVSLTSPGPIFFRQVRAGRGGRPFPLYKFRSMAVNTADPLHMGRVGGGHPLVTPVGRVIRRLKIDELPQLWNVLRGDLSVVGPRPRLLGQAEALPPAQRAILEVPPGLTGWPQVNGNTALSFEENVQLDLWYVARVSCWLDLKICLMTIDVILRGERPRPAALRAAGIDQRESHSEGA